MLRPEVADALGVLDDDDYPRIDCVQNRAELPEEVVDRGFRPSIFAL